MRGDYPLEVEPSNEISRMNREVSERYLELWDCGDEYDERRMESEWDAFPSRPPDRDLLP